MKDIKLQTENPYSYNDLCKIFDWTPTSGKGREYQFRELGQYSNWHKKGHKVFIDEIFDTPKEKIDKRETGKNNVYGTLLDDILLNSLMDNASIEVSRTQLFKEYIPIFSAKYYDLTVDATDIIEEHQLSKKLYNKYLGFAYSKTNQLVKTTCNRLHRRDIICYEEKLLIKDLLVSEDEHTDYASEELKKVIKEKGKIVYAEMEIAPCRRAIPNINKQFVKKVCDYVNNEPNINKCLYNFYPVHNIELLVDVEIEDVEQKIKELKNKIAFVIRKNIQEIEQEDDKDSSKKFFPYKAQKYIRQFEVMDKLVFGINDDTVVTSSNIDMMDDIGELPF
jgi:hypothetical protein